MSSEHDDDDDDDDGISLGSNDTEDSEDEDFVPEKASVAKGIKKKKLKKKKRKKPVKSPDMTELSLPKPAVRLSKDLDLSGSAVMGSVQWEHEMDQSLLGQFVAPPKDLAFQPDVSARTLKGWKVTRGSPDDEGTAQYRLFYAKQLPGMPFYDDAYHVLLTLDGPARKLVGGAATFNFIDLTTNGGKRMLILDVLALAVDPGSTERRGVGSQVVNALKAICRQEAHRLCAVPLLLTQADLACVGFWAKNGFSRALDANALVRSLRRASGATIFTGAVPMANILTVEKPPAASKSRSSVHKALHASATITYSQKRSAEEAARALHTVNR
jgi:hypothetical protein